MRHLKNSTFGSIYTGLTLLVSLIAAWLMLAAFDFFYGVWHDHGGIAEGIAKYAPQNRYRDGFEETSRDERLAIFHDIVISIHRSGKGLEEIHYETKSSGGRQRVFREPEIVHLQDVANLIDILKPVACVLVLVWLAAIFLMWRRRRGPPGIRQQAMFLAAIVAMIAILLWAIGAENVFNALHEWIFPDEHQWFFYYQDSLMSTMMLAPRLFAWIAAAWALLSLLLHFFLDYAVSRSLRKRQEVINVDRNRKKN